MPGLGVLTEGCAFDAILDDLWRDANVEVKSLEFVDGALTGPETERLVDAMDALLDVLLWLEAGVPEAARLVGGGGAKNLLPAGAADSWE